MMNDAINEPRAGVRINGQYPVDLESSDEDPVPQSETSASQPGGFEADVPQLRCDKEMETSSDESDSWFNGASPRSEASSKRPRTCAAPGGSVPSTTLSPTTAARHQVDDIIVEKQIRGLVARQCMQLRIHKDDRRSHADIAFDYAQLVHLRHQYVKRNWLEWEAPLSKQDQINIWNEDLYWWFQSERPENCRRRNQQLHSIFRVWLRQSFGEIQAIRDILRNSCCSATWRELQFRQNLMTADPNIKP
jgi:hypothetical protein